MKFFVASFNRASDGLMIHFKNELDKEHMLTSDYKDADYIIAVADRRETFDFVLERFRENIPIIHISAGEISQGTHDEVYRHSMTLMSCMQLCTHELAKKRVEMLCKSVDKKPNAYVVGNFSLDDTHIDESSVPNEKYDLVLYNPPTQQSKLSISNELMQILKLIKDRRYIWIEPNGDYGSELVDRFANTKTLPREKFLGLVKNCDRFIGNSTSMYYEAQFIMDANKIIPIGNRNSNRECFQTSVKIPNATKNTMKILKEL